MRTFIGSIGPVENVRMMVRSGHIHIVNVELKTPCPSDEIRASSMLHVTRLRSATRVHSQRCCPWLLWLLRNHQSWNLAHQSEFYLWYDCYKGYAANQVCTYSHFTGRKEDSRAASYVGRELLLPRHPRPVSLIHSFRFCPSVAYGFIHVVRSWNVVE